ncbi:hypothetical protein CDAR_536001 [Caerostris darwini]|uniref:Uncharacterized protein n=1 Tax=Caerostris darwini TaxID=1538125 RepID=A0AAV4QQB3_9ARAC|nr:hypothetical protein CDAR_536001 [Caerostris darwini]
MQIVAFGGRLQRVNKKQVAFYGHFRANVDMQIVASGNGLPAQSVEGDNKRAVIIAGPLISSERLKRIGAEKRRGGEDTPEKRV